MIITNEADRLLQEQHLKDTFERKVSALEVRHTHIFESLDETEQAEIQRSVHFGEGERPLIACVRTLANFALITNQRIVWRGDNPSALRSLTWREINTISTGTAQQQLEYKNLNSREMKIIEKQSWNSLEVSSKSGESCMIVFETGKILEWIHWCLLALHSSYRTEQRGKQDPDAYVAHKFSSLHRKNVLESDRCGCFYCLKIFAPSTITNWVDRDDETALCPSCGIDAVIGSQSGYPIEAEFLKRMNRFWF